MTQIIVKYLERRHAFAVTRKQLINWDKEALV